MRETSYTFNKGILKGLRPTSNNALNEEAFIQMQGAFVKDGIIQQVEMPTQIDLSSLECEHPFPQIFRLIGLTLVCTPITLYEYSHETGALTELITSTEGSTWTVADYNLFVIATNGNALIIRDGLSGEWKNYDECEIPTGICVCNLHGQLIIGGPGVQVSAGFMRSDI